METKLIEQTIVTRIYSLLVGYIESEKTIPENFAVYSSLLKKKIRFDLQEKTDNFPLWELIYTSKDNFNCKITLMESYITPGTMYLDIVFVEKIGE